MSKMGSPRQKLACHASRGGRIADWEGMLSPVSPALRMSLQVVAGTWARVDVRFGLRCLLWES